MPMSDTKRVRKGDGMPKVYLTETDRLCAGFSEWVYGQMKVNHVKQCTIAEKLGISPSALTQKLRKNRFNFEDFLFFVREFQPDEKKLREISGL